MGARGWGDARKCRTVTVNRSSNALLPHPAD
jgi:hypothetical protein